VRGGPAAGLTRTPPAPFLPARAALQGMARSAALCLATAAVVTVGFAGASALGAPAPPGRSLGGWVPGASSRTLYVDAASIGGRCSDARSAAAVTIATPWCSVAAAAAAAPGGSVVFVRAGRYPELDLRSYAPAAPVTFEGYGSELPEIAGMSIGSSGAPLSRNFAFEHLRFTNSVALTNFSDANLSYDEISLTEVPPSSCSGPPRTGTCAVRTPSALVLNPPGDNFTFADNYVHDGDLGILTRQPGTLTPFQNVAVDHNTFQHMGGVVMHVYDARGWRVSGNEFADDGIYANIDPDVHPDAVHLVGAADGVVLDGNYVHSTVGGRGFLMEPAGAVDRNVVVDNNVLVTGDFLLRVAGAATGLRIVNNTLWGTEAGSGNGLDIQGQASGTVLENNIIRSFQADPGATFAKADYNAIAQRFGGGLPRRGRHDTRRMPRFVAPWDFHLAAGSPGIGRGDPAAAPDHDADGYPRVFPDLGAYDYLPNLFAAGRGHLTIAVSRVRRARFRLSGAAHGVAGRLLLEVDRRSRHRWVRKRFVTVTLSPASTFAQTLRVGRHGHWRARARDGAARSRWVYFAS